MTGEAPEPPQGTPHQWAHPLPQSAHPPPGQPWYPPPTAYPPAQQGPGNDVAIAGFVLSVCAAALLFFSSGFAAPLTFVLGVLGIIFSRRGKQKVERGETVRSRGLAQAGFIVGIVAVGLSILAALFWIGLIVLAVTTDGFDDSTNPYEFQAAGALLAIGRAMAQLG